MKLLIIAICTVSHNAFIVTLSIYLSLFSSTTPQSPILRKRGQTTDIQSLVILSRLLQKTPIPYPFGEHRVEAHKNSLHNIPRINPLRISCFLWVAICKCISQSSFILDSVELRPSSSTFMPFCTPFCSIVREQYFVFHSISSLVACQRCCSCGGRVSSPHQSNTR